MLIVFGMLMYVIGWIVFLLFNDFFLGVVLGIVFIVYWVIGLLV